MMRGAISSMLLVLVACGGEATPADAGSDAGRARDAGSTEDAGGRADGGLEGGALDGGDALDAGAPLDAALDAAAASDAGSSCPVTVEDRLAGVCDGRGQIACTMWAREHGGAGAVAQCRPPDGRCARADSCSAAGCTCGGGPECGASEMCVAGVAGFSCVCAER